MKVGIALQKAMRCIQTANSEVLSGIFGGAQWTQQIKEILENILGKALTDWMTRSLVLKKFIESVFLNGR